MSKFHLIIFLVTFVVPVYAHAGTELIPMAGYRLSGEFEDINSGAKLDVDDDTAAGFLLNFDAASNTQYEFLYSRQSSRLRAGISLPTTVLFDIDIEYIHVGGIKLFPISEGLNSYFGAGIGITRFEPEVNGYGSESKFSLNISGGIKKHFTKALGLRAGFSYFGTPVNSSSAIFCGNSSGCTVRFQGDLFSQFEAGVSLILRF